MTRLMGDATHQNMVMLKKAFPTLPLVGLYVTGPPTIKATDNDYRLWPSAIKVTIDQGNIGSPVMDALVRDVEPGAWTAEKAVKRDGWIAARPTIYCDRNDLSAVIANGWRGDVWLAWPGYTSLTPPTFPGVNVVAVQRTTTAYYDLSTVFDDTWPYVKKLEKDMINVQVQPHDTSHIPFPLGSFTSIHIYRDFLTSDRTAQVRVAYHSQTSGYVVDTVILDADTPQVRLFTHPDIDAVSIENQSDGYQIGATLA